MIKTMVTAEKIDLERISKWRPSPQHGAINVFVGAVRSRNLGREVLAVEYECFTPLCQKIFYEIAEEASLKWGTDSNILVIHRHGRLLVGEPSVAIVATTGHRDESYKMTRYIIEEIKRRAPVWKKEFYTDGETEWVRGHALCQHVKGDHYEHDGRHSCGR